MGNDRKQGEATLSVSETMPEKEGVGQNSLSNGVEAVEYSEEALSPLGRTTHAENFGSGVEDGKRLINGLDMFGRQLYEGGPILREIPTGGTSRLLNPNNIYPRVDYEINKEGSSKRALSPVEKKNQEESGACAEEGTGESLANENINETRISCGVKVKEKEEDLVEGR
ncbi:hypothetical protein L6452_05685 [Arctium lappa]|uniref:Uncharacterized protein n=1 Tax=Arctium lappa TaxID=4217 RepID=A0ACB9EGS8_ARCLA|nr:hypothetical protein L6452_05685 [Arctium lappa]